MPKDKTRHLKDQGALNRRADSVKAPIFLENPFFDPQDLIQVKYEMLRAVEKEGQPIKHAAANFGLSRPTFYETRRTMEQEGLTGLIPKKTGPKTRHKLNAEVLAFVQDALDKDHTLNAQELAKRIKRKFRIQVHPRSIERALVAQKKNELAQVDRTLEISEDEQILPVYETLRHHALSTFERGSVGFGAAVLHNKGFLSWAQHAKSFCEGITPRATPSEGCCRIDDELTAVLTDLALRTLTQEEIVC